jgi:hypothetical protein
MNNENIEDLDISWLQEFEQIDNESQAIVQPRVDILKSGSSDRREDGKRLASLFSDIATLIQLDGDDQVVSNTEEIKEANVIAGKLLKLNLKNKYPNLALECNNYVTKLIGDDNVALDPDLRSKAVQAFRGLAWACNEGSK